MAMDIQDMVAAMAAKNEAFRGNEKVPEKVEVYNKLKEHAAAISKAMRTPWHADNLGLREQNTFIYVYFPLPVSILNDRYTFLVVYDDKDNEELTVEAESVGAAALMLPHRRRGAVLLNSTPLEVEGNKHRIIFDSGEDGIMYFDEDHD